MKPEACDHQRSIIGRSVRHISDLSRTPGLSAADRHLLRRPFYFGFLRFPTGEVAAISLPPGSVGNLLPSVALS